jgi:hypothetical protein
VRRIVAAIAFVIIIVLIGIGVNGCETAATNSALQNYTNNVSSLIQQSNQTGSQLFNVLSTASGAGSATNVQNAVNQTLSDAGKVLKKAQTMSVPGQVNTGNSKLLLALRMRNDGISHIASQIQPALGTTVTQSAIKGLAAQTELLYASDVIYKDYAVPEIYAAVRGAGTRFSGLPAGQFVPNVQWVIPSFIATELHITVPGLAPTKVAPGLHGHSLTSVSVDGTTLQTGSSNTIPAKPIPTFTLTFNNGGVNNETNVKCKVSINGSSVGGSAVVPETFAGKSATCQVKLNASPPLGTQSVVATIEKVPGETKVSNNTNTYTVTFQ